MGSLNNFLGKPKEIEIDGNKIIIHPLKVKSMALFSKKEMTPEETAEISQKILKLSIPDATDEEIDGLPMEVFVKLMEEINKLNGFTDERVDKVKHLIKQKQTGN